MGFRTTTINFDSILDTRIDEGIVDLTCYFRGYSIFDMIKYTKVLKKRFT